jgi:hypothetical protein
VLKAIDDFEIEIMLDGPSKVCFEQIVEDEFDIAQDNLLESDNEGRDGDNQENKLFLVKCGTPVSEMDHNELPSPRAEGSKSLV